MIDAEVEKPMNTMKIDVGGIEGAVFVDAFGTYRFRCITCPVQHANRICLLSAQNELAGFERSENAVANTSNSVLPR